MCGGVGWLRRKAGLRCTNPAFINGTQAAPRRVACVRWLSSGCACLWPDLLLLFLSCALRS